MYNSYVYIYIQLCGVLIVVLIFALLDLLNNLKGYVLFLQCHFCWCLVLLSLECFACFDFVCQNFSLTRIERASMPVRLGLRDHKRKNGQCDAVRLEEVSMVSKSFWWVSSLKDRWFKCLLAQSTRGFQFNCLTTVLIVLKRFERVLTFCSLHEIHKDHALARSFWHFDRRCEGASDEIRRSNCRKVDANGRRMHREAETVAKLKVQVETLKAGKQGTNETVRT